jgi:hypothetical protein
MCVRRGGGGRELSGNVNATVMTVDNDRAGRPPSPKQQKKEGNRIAAKRHRDRKKGYLSNLQVSNFDL